MTAPTPGAVLDADGWIEWHGGENPVPGQMVDVRQRGGSLYKNDPSDGYFWAHGFAGGDIIAYRLARPTPDRLQTREQMLADLSPPAQPEPGAGELEVVAVRTRGPRMGWMHCVPPAPAFWSLVEELVTKSDADARHTQAQAKIARLEGEVAERDAELKRLGSACDKLRITHREEIHETWMPLVDEWKTRTLSAEAYAAKVREALAWYAGDGSTYDGIDIGQRARAALEATK